MKRADFADLMAFAMIAGERSFTRAGNRLGISSSALSHAMRHTGSFLYYPGRRQMRPAMRAVIDLLRYDGRA
jgi:DNA-binding transcriptional LysR family regulator|tara:strand:+ start:5132 stop:5347 length:216 start_codon:yes stop_codon:yes gene_type:complete